MGERSVSWRPCLPPGSSFRQEDYAWRPWTAVADAVDGPS